MSELTSKPSMLQTEITCKRCARRPASYLTQHWLPNHAGSLTPDGEAVAAPSSFAGVNSHIATELEVLGRSGEWNPTIQQGSPMHSTQIMTMLKGYSNHAAELGYRTLGAMPLSEDEMRRLLCNMLQQLSTASGSEQMLLIRDGLLFSLLWQVCFRGCDAGGVLLSNISLLSGESVMPYLYPLVKLGPSSEVHMIPDSTKNKKGCHCRLTLSCDELCFTCWLQLAIHSYHAASQPITSFLSRLLLKGMSCSNTWARLTWQLKAPGMYTGQSVHSTRRGQMMHQLQQQQTQNNW